MKTRFRKILILIFLLILSSCKSDKPAYQDDMEKAMNMMMKNMHQVKPVGDPDKDYAKMMIDHYQGMIDMAKIEIMHGKNPEMQEFARISIASYEKDMAYLKDWLEKNNNKP